MLLFFWRPTITLEHWILCVFRAVWWSERFRLGFPGVWQWPGIAHSLRTEIKVLWATQ